MAKYTKDKSGKDKFVKDSIPAMRAEGYTGMHTVYSGFNTAFKLYFGESPIDHTKDMQKRKQIAIVPCKGGVQLYLPDEAPQRDNDKAGKDALKKLGIKS